MDQLREQVAEAAREASEAAKEAHSQVTIAAQEASRAAKEAYGQVAVAATTAAQVAKDAHEQILQVSEAAALAAKAAHDDSILIYNTLMNLKESIGSITSDIVYLKDNFNKHVDIDLAVEERVSVLEAARNQQIGKSSIWMIVVGVLGGIFGTAGSILVEYFLFRR